MHPIDRRRWLALALSSPVLVAGCGGGTDTTKAQVRFINASAYDALTLEVDDEDLFSSVGWGDETPYREVDPGDCESTISRSGSASALVPAFTPSLSEDDSFTVLAWGPLGDLDWTLIDENSSEPDDDESRLRVFNGATDAGALDVYVTAASESLEDAVPTFPAAAVGELGAFATIDAGTWRVRVTAAGSKTDVRLDRPGVVFGGERVHTLVLSAADSGVLVDGLLLREQTRALTRLEVDQARVRVAAATVGGQTVTATVAGQELLSSASPAVGDYARIDAGPPELAVAIGGVPVSVPAAPSLVAGADYTVVVFGSAGAAASAWLLDDNRLPTDRTKARIRLVNAVSDLDSTLSLKLGTSQLATSVKIGSGSDYVSATPTSSGTLVVTSPALGSALLTLPEQILEAGKVYTVLVGGSADAPVGGLIEDRT